MFNIQSLVCPSAQIPSFHVISSDYAASPFVSNEKLLHMMRLHGPRSNTFKTSSKNSHQIYSENHIRGKTYGLWLIFVDIFHMGLGQRWYHPANSQSKTTTIRPPDIMFLEAISPCMKTTIRITTPVGTAVRSFADCGQNRVCYRSLHDDRWLVRYR